MNRYPMRAAMAALRSLRRAAWAPSTPEETIIHMAALVEPMDTLIAWWENLGATIVGYEEEPCGDAWALAHEALLDLDVALGEFFGPSGWEPQRSTEQKRSRSRPRA